MPHTAVKLKVWATKPNNMFKHAPNTTPTIITEL